VRAAAARALRRAADFPIDKLLFELMFGARPAAGHVGILETSTRHTPKEAVKHWRTFLHQDDGVLCGARQDSARFLEAAVIYVAK
jgi:hypothetical protein